MNVGGALTLPEVFLQRARGQPEAVALRGPQETLTYSQLAHRVSRLAGALRAMGLKRGDRIAAWSENRLEYVELELAAAWLGLIVACLNWRLSAQEQRHCIQLVSPSACFVSPRYAAALAALEMQLPNVRTFGADFDGWRDAAAPIEPDAKVQPEDGLVILYTSGTTGLPKGALVSQRAMLARAMVFAADYGIGGEDAFIAWSPLFHMAATDHSLATLLLGGEVVVCDGLDLPRICETLRRRPVGWLLAMPGMVDTLAHALENAGGPLQRVRMVGAMADLVPPTEIARLSGLVKAPYLNTFGSTETGLPPASGSLLPAGERPTSMSKRQSSWCLLKLVDDQDREVEDGRPGEMAMRGPTLFSGYWGNDAANAQAFRGGWFHMGDVFVRRPDGRLDFVDRLKYLIKSGGENIYPAEIERVLLSHPSVHDAAIVRRADARWGEIPVAFIVMRDGTALDADAMLAFCRERLASYKLPREFRVIAAKDLPRNSTGKILRHELEKRL
ncbi:class I adenylate-forming enzyme family protein [Ramlibacter humi]|uniref:Long-chain fatty acid--CoA ligase n=1 Tax=Ramlibacter humi TaxID=2530451 RepID=A0A4Z0CE04_9BURK|nr:AMP-binding protein [Ramlibacter humi]TFZ08818.1 long-chain fatty acid--CoA ligase [Ramlibacter humi]